MNVPPSVTGRDGVLSYITYLELAVPASRLPRQVTAVQSKMRSVVSDISSWEKSLSDMT
jgi:hypothetical protein